MRDRLPEEVLGAFNFYVNICMVFDSLNYTNNKIALNNLAQFRLGYNPTNAYIDFIIVESDSLCYLFRVYTAVSRLVMHKSIDNGASWTTLWDKTLT